MVTIKYFFQNFKKYFKNTNINTNFIENKCLTIEYSRLLNYINF